jgi:hypothetical protein
MNKNQSPESLEDAQEAGQLAHLGIPPSAPHGFEWHAPAQEVGFKWSKRLDAAPEVTGGMKL